MLNLNVIYRKLILAILVATAVAAAPLSSHGQTYPIDPSEPYWATFVAGAINDIPNSNVRKYLLETHHNNAYAEAIAHELDTVGVFSPTKDNVFWLPTIDVPVEESEWRFLSSTADMPQEMQRLAFYKKDGKNYVRMFIHPFSTLRPHFAELAEANGGIKYEFQAVTTASTRSFVVWKTNSPKSKTNAGVDFPNDPKKIFKAKVSIYNVSIDGSRRNPAKKMVRAAGVSRLFGAISEETKNEIGFDFEREVLTGVPIETDAGFVIREGLPELRGLSPGERAEPAFSVLSSDRLNQLVNEKSNPLEYITNKLFSPIANSVAYLLMEEGMIGENHTQNFDFVVSDRGIPTGKVILRDADAFRVNLSMRALNGRNLDKISDIENPFFYLKEAAFSATQSTSDDVMTLNSLMDYLLSPGDSTSMVKTIYDWCKKIPAHKAWCTSSKILDSFLENLAKKFSKYLGREVAPQEVYVQGYELASKGTIALFKERLQQLRTKSAEEAFVPEIQTRLLKYFEKMKARGLVQFSSSQVNIDLSIHKLILYTKDGNTHIRVIKKESRAGSNPVVAIALLDKRDIGLTTRFLEDIKSISGAASIKGCKDIFKKQHLLATPIMQNMGGGNNVR